MTAFNFKPAFVPLILSGRKFSTIRKSKRGAVDRTMQLYTGQRTTDCRKIADVICAGIYEIEIHANRLVSCAHHDAGYLYRQEGFNSPDEFIQFFEDHYGLPFRGYLHEWKPLTGGQENGE